jgi:preprotein translocase subunit SecY
LYRFGSFIPTPGVNTVALKAFFSDQGAGTLFGLFDLFVGGNFERASVFALGIMPYITASIVIQLLGSIIPYFEKLKKEGAEGQKKINQITRYGTVFIGLFNAIGMAVFLQNAPNVVAMDPVLFTFTTVISMVTGTMIILWLGEQITENGIGNGISLIIFAGIIARYPEGFIRMFMLVFTGGGMTLTQLMMALSIMLLVTAAVILVTEATRKIQVQYPKRIIGRKTYGGQSTYIPLKVNTAGVIPIIFAQSVIMMPRTIATFFPNSATGDFILRAFSPGAALYTIFYMTLIIFFAYFYTAIVMNPTDMAENMKKHGGYVHGQQPGKSTAKYINNILTHITLPGAFFFAVVAVIPEFMMAWLRLPFYFGGTGLIIIVGVALDTLNQIESHLTMRHYDGFMKKGKLRGRSG